MRIQEWSKLYPMRVSTCYLYSSVLFYKFIYIYIYVILIEEFQDIRIIVIISITILIIIRNLKAMMVI